MAAPPIEQRLSDLLIQPRETLEVEAKGWIDIANNGEHKALLAKAMIALANHGGGAILIGFEESANGLVPAEGRPADLSGYTPDTVNAVVNRYAEPAFHCDAQIVTAPGGAEAFPIIVVPGGHTVPIKAKRSGPNGQFVQMHMYYVRRPGPQSEPPQTAQEWDTLLARCLSNRRDELFGTLRRLLGGVAPSPPVETDLGRVTQWFEASSARWRQLADELPTDHPARLERGYYAVAFEVAGVEPRRGGRLLETLRAGVVRHSGWPPFWVPTRSGIEPYIYDGNVECWLGPGSPFQEPAYSDYWRVSPQGHFFLIRGYQEDGDNIDGVRPGEVFDITLPVWRLGEILLYAANMAGRLDVPDAQVTLLAKWTGLAGRTLTHLSGTRALYQSYTSRQDTYADELTARADQISDELPELVHRVVEPLYELFDFFQLPASLTNEELTRMTTRQF